MVANNEQNGANSQQRDVSSGHLRKSCIYVRTFTLATRLLQEWMGTRTGNDSIRRQTQPLYWILVM